MRRIFGSKGLPSPAEQRTKAKSVSGYSNSSDRNVADNDTSFAQRQMSAGLPASRSRMEALHRLTLSTKSQCVAGVVVLTRRLSTHSKQPPLLLLLPATRLAACFPMTWKEPQRVGRSPSVQVDVGRRGGLGHPLGRLIPPKCGRRHPRIKEWRGEKKFIRTTSFCLQLSST